MEIKGDENGKEIWDLAELEKSSLLGLNESEGAKYLCAAKVH